MMASIQSLPYELVCIINSSLPDKSSSNFGRSCRFIYATVNPALYRRAKAMIGVLFWAVEKENIGTIEKLIAAGADTNCVWEEEIWHDQREPLSINYLSQPFGPSYRGSLATNVTSNGPDTSPHTLASYEAQLMQLNNSRSRRARLGRNMTAIEIRHTPIHLAVRSGNGPITELLLSHGADVNSISKRMCDCRPLYRTYLAIDPEYEWTPLHIAMCGNRLSTMKLLMARGASFNVGCQGNEEVSLGVTALHSASILGNLSVLVAVLQHYAPDINTPDTTGLTPLLWAYLSEYLGKTLWKVIEFLLEQGANINAVDEHGDSLLLIACNIGRFDDAVWLIEHGADVRLTARRSGTTALHTICKVTYNDATSGRSASQRNAVRFPNSKRLVLARTLLEAGADVDAMDAEGDVALVSAARCCHLGLIELLLDHGANPNVRAKRDETALLAACSTPASVPAYVLKDTVELLLERGASIHAQTDIGKTVLDVLCVLRSNSSMYTNSDREVIASMVRTFLRSGIRPIGAPGSEQSLVLQYFMGGYLACSKLLIEYGAMHPTPNGLKKMIAHAIKCDDIEAIQFVLSFEGAKKLMATPSRLAASLKTATDGVVELLMDNGAPYKYITKDGTSCLHYACARPLLKIDFFRKLLEGGANLNASTKKGLTPLKAAIKIRRLELVELLLEYGADPDYTGSAEVAISGESSPLVMASQSGRMDILAALLRRSKDAHNPLWQQISSADPTDPATP